MSHSRFLFLLFSSFQHSRELNINFADDWIRTMDLWCQKRLLYQLSYTHCPNSFSISSPLSLLLFLSFFSLSLFFSTHFGGVERIRIGSSPIKVAFRRKKPFKLFQIFSAFSETNLHQNVAFTALVSIQRTDLSILSQFFSFSS